MNNTTTSKVTETFVLINEQPFPTDSEQEITLAREALRDAGLLSAKIHYGDPEDPDAHQSSTQVLFAAD